MKKKILSKALKVQMQEFDGSDNSNGSTDDEEALMSKKFKPMMKKKENVSFKNHVIQVRYQTTSEKLFFSPFPPYTQCHFVFTQKYGTSFTSIFFSFLFCSGLKCLCLCVFGEFLLSLSLSRWALVCVKGWAVHGCFDVCLEFVGIVRSGLWSLWISICYCFELNLSHCFHLFGLTVEFCAFLFDFFVRKL